jgi:osmoprotectant transport system permease protein
VGVTPELKGCCPGSLAVTLFAQAALPRDITLREWLLDASAWTGPNGIIASLIDTLLLSGAVVVTAVLLAVPSAAVLAHLGRARVASAWFVNIGRAVPTFALAALLVPISLRAGYGFEPWPIFIALTLMALPPIYLGTYTSIQGVDRAAVDAARAVGLRPRDILLRVELPLASNVIFTGIRVSAVQVVATEPIRAFLGGDGLGRYVRDGLGQRNDTLLVGGAALVALLAGSVAVLLTWLQRTLEPTGVRRLRPSALARVTVAATDVGGMAIGGEVSGRFSGVKPPERRTLSAPSALDPTEDRPTPNL